MSMFEKDWIMRQIKDLTKMIAIGVLHKAGPEYEIVDEQNLSESDKLHLQLMKLLESNRVKDAMQLLQDSITNTDLDHLKVAMDFYDRLSTLSDEKRLAAGISISDIQAGLDAVTSCYGIYL